MYKTILTITFLILFNSLYAQEGTTSEVDSNYYGYWINEDYYNSLMGKVTPLESYKLNKPFIYIKITKGLKKIEFSKYLNEVGTAECFVKNSVLCFTTPFNNILYSVNLTGKDKITIGYLNKSGNFIKYKNGNNKNFKCNEPIHNLINKIFFTGNYISLDSSKSNIQFTSDGKVFGIPEYTNYDIFANYLFNNSYNAVRFSNKSMRKNLPIFAWDISGDTLTVFSTIDTGELVYKKDKIFLKLIKTEFTPTEE